MATAELIDIRGEKVGEVEIKDEIFNCEVKLYLIHDVVRMQFASRRRGTVVIKTRKDVNASGSKLYKQKGMGRAR